MYLSYSIDKNDVITDVGGSWDAFATSNDGHELTANTVINRPLWDFINDPTICEVYRHLIASARDGRNAGFEFRCDAPGRRRLLRMNISGLEGDRVVFETKLLRETLREQQPILDRRSLRSMEVLAMCAWCARLRVGEEWDEVEVAVDRLELFHSSALPSLSHGMCAECRERVMAGR